MVIRVVIIFAIYSSLTLVAYGQNSDFTAAFLDCAQIENPPKRYECYDNMAKIAKQSFSVGGREPTGTLSENIVSKPAPSIEVPQADNGISEQKKKSGLFGFKAPVTNEADFGLTQRAKVKEEITQIDGSIRDFSFSNTGHLTVLLDNGQIWKQLSGDSIKIQDYRMKRQTSVTIKASAFGSHRMTLFPSQKSLRVKRKR